MTPPTPTGPRFTRRELPAKDVAAFISERFASPPLPCRGEILIHAPAEIVARWSGQSTVVEPIDPDRCRVTASSWSWTGLAAWAAMYDADIEIIGPSDLAEAAATLAARFARSTR
jgi:hypothetical protein